MDEIPEVVSVRRFKEFSYQEKDELYETLLDLGEAVKDIPKKSLRKTLELTFAVLRYKGEQAAELQEKLLATIQQTQDGNLSTADRILDENDRLKLMLEKLEDEKSQLSRKNKELADEIVQQQKRLQDALNTAELSDKDSTDPLSELDKQEELLRNISCKNKHIKRLLHEIEILQNQNIQQSKTIIHLDKSLQLESAKISELKHQLQSCENECETMKVTINELNIEIARLEGNITYLEEERESSERDLKDFIGKLEIKAQSWKSLLDKKEIELTKLRGTIESADGFAGGGASFGQSAIDGNKSLTEDDEQLKQTLALREQQIWQLENKLKSMAEEMLTTTQLMNKLSNEREIERNPQNPRSCCKLLEQLLQATNKRCCELSEMLERSEEDNTLKSKQAHHAIRALEAYQRGEDGLPKALKKCSILEQKIISRDKQIRALVTQLNSMHEITYENSVLRKRLNIPDDEIIATKNLAAKERSKEKIIDRLTIKLRASEEMRLQLKLEKNDLRKQITKLNRKLMQKTNETLDNDESTDPNAISIEIGEIADSSQADNTFVVMEMDANHTCPQCHCHVKGFSAESESSPKPMLAELQAKYHEVLEENETLRHGMLEILEKLREYDATSDHITIDTETLYRLLQALQTSVSAPTSPKQLQVGLRALQDREEALRLLLNTTTQSKDSTTETDELPSIDSIRQQSSLSNIERSSLPFSPHRPQFDKSSSAPALATTETHNHNQTTITLTATLEKSKAEKRSLQQIIDELSIYRKRYEELRLEMTSLENADTTRYSVELADQVTALELEMTKLRSSYQFMREDFDETLASAQRNQSEHIEIVGALKLDIIAKDLEIKRLETEFSHLQTTRTYSAEEYEALLSTKSSLQAQLAQLVELNLSGKIAPEFKFSDICSDYGIIDDNLELDFLTVEEYKMQKENLNNAEQRQHELRRKTMQLESLLAIAQDQIKSQQRLLNEITDNHIDLRHLVADLQSTNEEKHLLAKIQRELGSANLKLSRLEAENEELNCKCLSFESKLNAEQERFKQVEFDYRIERTRKDTKIKFLLKSLYALKEKYTKFTPLIFLTNFVYAYTNFSKREQQTSKQNNDIDNMFANLQDHITAKIKENLMPNDDSSNLIKLIKTETQYKLLKENFAKLQNQFEALQQEMSDQLVRFATETEHWQTIEILYQSNVDEKSGDKVTLQNGIKLRSVAVNTETSYTFQERRLSNGQSNIRQIEVSDKCISPIESPVRLRHTHTGTQTAQIMEKVDGVSKAEWTKTDAATVEVMIQTIAQSMDTQAVQTQPTNEATERSSPSRQIYNEQETLQEKLKAAEKRNAELQHLLELANAELSRTNESKRRDSTREQQDNSIEKTITSFNALLMEKDKSISKYQDLLQSERDQNNMLVSKLRADADGLKSTVTNLNFNIKTKDMEILELKTKLEALSQRRNSKEKLDLATNSNEENVDNSLNELSDEKIEEMFEENATKPNQTASAKTPDATANSTTVEQVNKIDTVESSLNAQLKGLEEKYQYAERNLLIKEEEISLLKEKLNLYQDREKSLVTTQNPEVEKLRLLIEEKDKHIDDLMDTLKNFHEDQQNYLKDNSSYSENQITKLSADLLRMEATNKIYQTQVEALRRQVTSLTHREKQARELNQSLRNQLIKRPVVSIKTELNTRVKTESMQKRIQQLELELEEARAQIQRQQIIIETKRAKSASEVGLWEKQKRWQQTAEKYKTKFEETECALEKTRTLLQSARNTIVRLEKDKQVLDMKLGRAAQNNSCVKFCRSTLCANSNRARRPMGGEVGGVSGKYTPSESPETFTGGSSEFSSPTHSVCDGGSGSGTGGGGATGDATGTGSSEGRAAPHQSYNGQHGSLIEALKARIELQQRKILAMEIEGKGNNAMTVEMEKLQEKLSAIDAQNIRLEARNLQLQLDNDLLRQNDATVRLQKRVKHLEDYIIALKEELAQAEARRVICKCAGVKISAQHSQTQSTDQTILSLRNLVEKLRAENKYLKDGRRSSESRSPTDDVNRLQQAYAEALEKITALQLELKAKTGKPSNDTALHEELQLIKEQLVKKTQLLQKAKVLLTRAAAKEKILKEQLSMWKRKCSELQNVPVIEEISE